MFNTFLRKHTQWQFKLQQQWLTVGTIMQRGVPQKTLVNFVPIASLLYYACFAVFVLHMHHGSLNFICGLAAFHTMCQGAHSLTVLLFNSRPHSIRLLLGHQFLSCGLPCWLKSKTFHLGTDWENMLPTGSKIWLLYHDLASDGLRMGLCSYLMQHATCSCACWGSNDDCK